MPNAFVCPARPHASYLTRCDTIVARMMRFSSIPLALVALVSCGAGLNQTSITCTPGRTLLDGVCVNNSVADYVACVRAQGAVLGGSKSQEISATAGTLGLNAGGAAELKENLEKRYSVSDAATLEIIRACGGTAPASVARAAAANAPQMSCEGMTVESGTKAFCYLKNGKSFKDAKRDCERMGGILGAPESQEESDALWARLGSSWGYAGPLWLGCTDQQHEGQWSCADGKNLGYTAWSSGQPDNAGNNEKCLQWWAGSGRWNDAQCGLTMGYLCRGDAGYQCGGRRVVAGTTVFCAHSDLLDWATARDRCEKEGAHLATIVSDQENQAVFDALRNRTGVDSWVWFGGFWIGVTDEAKEGSFVHVDSSPLRYGNWAPNQPDNAGGVENCVESTFAGGLWNDLSCDWTLPYVCQSK